MEETLLFYLTCLKPLEHGSFFFLDFLDSTLLFTAIKKTDTSSSL
jgi:hypothetical protein